MGNSVLRKMIGAHNVSGQATQKTCFKLYGRSGGFRGLMPKQAYQVASNEDKMNNDQTPSQNYEETPTLKAEVEHLKSLMASLSKPSSACSLAMTGKNSQFFSFNVSGTMFEDLWIIDSDVTNHITPHSSCFHILIPLVNNSLLLLMGLIL